MSFSNLILLVEDDVNDAFFFSRALSDAGFSGRLEHVTDVEAAKAYLSGNGEFADRAKNPPPDLVIADSAVSPRGSGVELLEWQRAAGLNIPFVILTGGIDPAMRERAEAAGVRRVLTKPGNFKDLADELREVVSELPQPNRSSSK